MKKIYLAIPYTGIEEESFRVANEVAGRLMHQGYIVFSPISHTHPIAKSCDMPKGWQFWERQDTSFIEWCDELCIVKLDGFFESRGVNAELKIAKKLKKEVTYICPEELGVEI